MSRGTLADAQWARIAALVPGKAGDRGATGRDNRLFADAVLWIARTGAPWRDLPPELGDWNSTWRRFDRWSRAGVWEHLFEALAEDPDFEYAVVDATIVRAHRRAAGPKGGLMPKRWGARAAARARSCTSRPMRWAARRASCSRPANATR